MSDHAHREMALKAMATAMEQRASSAMPDAYNQAMEAAMAKTGFGEPSTSYIDYERLAEAPNNLIEQVTNLVQANQDLQAELAALKEELSWVKDERDRYESICYQQGLLTGEVGLGYV